MDRVIRFFRDRSLAILLFHFGVLLFSWPFLTIPAGAGGLVLFTYLLTAWFGLVIMLGAMGWAIGRANNAEEEQ